MANMQIGEQIKKERIKGKVSLREFARKCEISAAYLVDIEKGRRVPNHELLQKISDFLDIPLTSLQQNNLEMPKHVKSWIEKHPLFSRLFRFALKEADPLKAIEKLEGLSTRTIPQSNILAIYESELQAIALETSSWDVETGGDLFGLWGDIPIIYLATKAGPKAIRNDTHFRLDVDYLIDISSELSNQWGLRYFGDWHSHHRLGLHSPSSGDRNRIKRLGEKNNYNAMAEFITSFAADQKKNRNIQVHPFIYGKIPEDNPDDCLLIVLKGLSPIREIMMRRKLMPEQRFDAYSTFPIDNVNIPEEPLGRVGEDGGNPQKQISERLFLNARSVFKRICSKDIETHQASFGRVIVVPVRDEQYIAFAVADKWPHNILQVDWMDRKTGQSTELEGKNAEMSLLDIDGLVDCYESIRERKK